MAMRMAAGRARGAWSAPRPGRRVDFFRSSPGVAPATTVRFGARRAGGSRVMLCLASRGGRSGGGGEWEREDKSWKGGEWEPADSSCDGSMADEGMAALWERIREVEEGEDREQPDEGGVFDVWRPRAEWTELEQRHYVLYVAAVREALGFLFAMLARERPALGVAVVALVLLSVPASVLNVSAELIRAVYSILAAVLNRTM